MSNSILIRKYLGITQSPLHMGARSRNSSVDMAIARDVDMLPVIPASALKGCARAYSFIEYGLQDCDGKGQQCSQPHLCASCAVFGYASYHRNQGYQGSTSLVLFSNGLMLFIPLQTSAGMIWLASAKRLAESGIIPSVEERDLLTSSSKFPNVIVISKALSQEIKELNIQVGSLSLTSESIISVDTENWIGTMKCTLFMNVASLCLKNT